MPAVDEPVALSEYQPMWPQRYAEEARVLVPQLGGTVAAIEHIGSTAVPAMPAKPVVDLMLGVADLDESQPVVEILTLNGYEDCGGAAGRRYLRKRSAHAFNAQVVEHGGELWRNNLLLRDYLRANPPAARAYANAKVAAAAAAPMLLAYSERKRQTIQRLLAAAEQWRAEA